MEKKWWVFWQMAKLEDEKLQKRIDDQNQTTLPYAMVAVRSEGDGGYYLHFVVLVEGVRVLEFGGGTRLEDALDAAKAIHKSYEQGRRRVQKEMRAALGLDQ